MSWEKVRLGDMCLKIASGATPLGGKDNYKENGISLIRSLNVHDFKFLYKDLAFIDTTQSNKLSNVVVEKNDILLNITGASVGRCTMVPDNTLPARVNQHVMIVRANAKIVNPYFLLYLINSTQYKSKLMMLSETGATREALTKDDISNFQIKCPFLNIQNKIANILSNYDNLIENNTKRIKLLEEMAGELYKEWFVRLRFPNYENTKIINGIPTGWKLSTIGKSVNNFDSTRKPISKENRERIQGIYPYYGASSILNYIDKYIFEGKYLLMGEDGTVITRNGTPMLQFIKGKFWVSNHAHVLTGKDISTEYLYLFLNSFSISGYITGTAQPKINQENLNSIKILIPDNYIIKKFDEYVLPIFEEIDTLILKNKNLKETRNLLLPRLLSGKLNIEDLEIV